MQEMIGLFEIFIDSKTIYQEWSSGDYFEAGLYTGKGVINAYFTGYSVFNKYLGLF